MRVALAIQHLLVVATIVSDGAFAFSMPSPPVVCGGAETRRRRGVAAANVSVHATRREFAGIDSDQLYSCSADSDKVAQYCEVLVTLFAVW